MTLKRKAAKNPPERLFLQVGENDFLGDDGDWDEVTWCRKRVNDSDVEYVRAALQPSTKLPPALDEEDALKRLRDIRYHLANIPPVLVNQATVEALAKVESHISDITKRPLIQPSEGAHAQRVRLCAEVTSEVGLDAIADEILREIDNFDLEERGMQKLAEFMRRWAQGIRYARLLSLPASPSAPAPGQDTPPPLMGPRSKHPDCNGWEPDYFGILSECVWCFRPKSEHVTPAQQQEKPTDV